MSSSMENYQGDLADIIRATTGSTNSDELLPLALTDTWQFNHPDPMNFSTDDFGHPFSYSLEDPFLHDLNISGGTASGFFSGSSSGSAVNTREFGDGMKNNLSNKIVDEKMKINILSPLIAPTLASNDIITTNNTSVHMSSPRNMGTKRRKSPAKKVVSIPAPAPPNSRPTGEIVPSDLWAWRKYGQKPIKGSPYPRGYYRCSSSKGCSARKQVERSKTEPNMLVITYTSDHNHPWPTQRNALAGSTRAQLPKNNSAPNISSPKMKDEQKENNKDSVTTQITCTPPVKEERKELNKDCFEDFFADLGEIDGDPLNLFFTRGFSPGEERENSKHKVLDPFNFCEWTGSSSINNTSCDEAKEGFLTRP